MSHPFPRIAFLSGSLFFFYSYLAISFVSSSSCGREIDLACSSVDIVEGGRASIIFLFDDEERRLTIFARLSVKRRIPESVIFLPFLGKFFEIPSTNCTQTPETVK